MRKKITDIPFLGVLIDCFPDREQEFYTMNQEEVTDEQWLAVARWWRNALLSESDWSQVTDNSLTADQREAYRIYRQELREITKTSTPTEIAFPALPTFTKESK